MSLTAVQYVEEKHSNKQTKNHRSLPNFWKKVSETKAPPPSTWAHAMHVKEKQVFSGCFCERDKQERKKRESKQTNKQNKPKQTTTEADKLREHSMTKHWACGPHSRQSTF